MPVGLAAMTRRRRMSGEVFFPEYSSESSPSPPWTAGSGASATP